MRGDLGSGCWLEAPPRIFKIVEKMFTTQSGSIVVSGIEEAIERAKSEGSEWVYYDMENIWPDACADDLKDPIASIREAGTAIRKAGLRPMMANYWDSLPDKPILPYPKQVGWRDWWKAQARAGDSVDIQLPGYPQNQPQQFGELTKKATDLIRKTNPGTEFILINMIEYMSDNKQGLERAWQEAKPHVDGRWVWK